MIILGVYQILLIYECWLLCENAKRYVRDMEDK